MKESGFYVRKFPPSRLFTMDIGKLGMKRHHIKALIEIDITEARELIRKRKKDNPEEGLSFTSWVIKCIAYAIEQFPEVNGLRKGKNKVVIFRDIDISIMVERSISGTMVPLPLIIRNCNKKTIKEIHSEIENAKHEPVKKGKSFVLGNNGMEFSVKIFSMIPQFLRLVIWKILLSSPFRIKKMMGTVIVSSIGMKGNASGWFIPYSIHPVCFAISSIISKPDITVEHNAEKEFLQMTVLIDHDVTDGAPAARFITRLNELMKDSSFL